MRPATRDASSAASPKAIWADCPVWRPWEARFSRNLERLTSAIAFAALVIGGSMLLMTPMGGWHDILGEAMLVTGIGGMLMTAIRALRRDHGLR